MKERKEMVKEQEKEKEPKIFVFGSCGVATVEATVVKERKEKEKEKEPKIFVFGNCEEATGRVTVDKVQFVTYYERFVAETDSEIYFKGGLVAQVGEVHSPPEPEKIQFLHKMQGEFKVATIWGGQSLEDWARQLLGEGAWEGIGGYFTTRGGKVLNSNAPVVKLGLHPSQEVVLQGRLRGGGFSGGGKGARGSGGHSIQAGDWSCGNCHQPGCRNTRSSCYRCGAPRYQEQGALGRGIRGQGTWMGGIKEGLGLVWVVIIWLDPRVGIRHTPLEWTLRRGKGLSNVGGETKTRWVGIKGPVLVLVLAVA